MTPGRIRATRKLLDFGATGQVSRCGDDGPQPRQEGFLSLTGLRTSNRHRPTSARQAHAILGRTGLPFWQDESYDHWVRGPEELAKVVRYMEKNPVVAGRVSKAEDWRWSSAFGMAEGQA